MSIYGNKPEPFFTIFVHDLAKAPGLTSAFIGFETDKWLCRHGRTFKLMGAALLHAWNICTINPMQ
jgi:hypothetical protein